MLPQTSSRRYWEARAGALALRINVAAWLARVAPAVFAVASGFAVLLYALRRVAWPLGGAWLALAGALAVAALACAWMARRSFFEPADARVLLESRLKLDSRLTAAALELVPWPPVPIDPPPVVRWRLEAPFGWMAAAAGLIVAALYAPIPAGTGHTAPTGSPPALLQTQEMLTALKEMKVAEPQALEQLEERARQLARRPADEQYSHSALEAADALRDQTAVGAAALARAAESGARALQTADNDMTGAAGRLAAALSGMRDGSLPANQALLANLPASASDLQNLTPDQRAQLAQQLAKIGQGLRGIAGAAGAGAQIAQPDGEDTLGGGLGGGGDAAPLMLARQQSDAGEGNAEALGVGDLKRFALGDKLGTTTGAHQVDPNAEVGPMAAGAIAAPASGGEAVWVNRLTPGERAALKNFFK